MLERVTLTLLILGSLGLLALGWNWYKPRLVRTIQVEAVATGRPTLLYFSGDFCVPCKLQQAPIVERLAARFGEAVSIRKYDVTEHPDLAGRYRVLTVPTTVVLDAEGQVRHINYGVTEQARLEEQLAMSEKVAG